MSEAVAFVKEPPHFIMPIEIQKLREDIDIITPENERHFCQLIFFKDFENELRWHITIPEVTDKDGFLGFCGIRTWAKTDTQNRQKLFQKMDAERSAFCDRCAQQFIVAEPELKRQGYLRWSKTFDNIKL